LAHFWLQNPGVREWALTQKKFSEGDIEGEENYARQYYKWNPKAVWDTRELPPHLSLAHFWLQNPSVREWALTQMKFSEGDIEGEENYARQYYKWNLKAVWDSRELPNYVMLDDFWKQNPGVRIWAIKNGKFNDGDIHGERTYANQYFKWNLQAKWSPQTL
jgi:hypothetical protein